MNCKGVIFDLDGTLVDSIEDIGDSMNKVLNENHFPLHSTAEYKTLVGRGLMNLTQLALPENARDEETISRCFKRMMEVYSEDCTIKTRPYDGVMPLLQKLKSLSLPLAVFSNKADELTQKIVETLFPGYFNVVLGMTTEELKKPNPVCALRIAEQLRVAPSEIAYIGDTGIDMETAANAGMYGIGVLWGFRTKEELEVAGAKNIIAHPLELIQLL